MNKFITLIMILTTQATKVYMSMDRKMVLVIPGRDLLNRRRLDVKNGAVVREVLDVKSNPLIHKDLKESIAREQLENDQENSKDEKKSNEKDSSKNRKDVTNYTYKLCDLFILACMSTGLAILCQYEREREERKEMSNYEVLVFVMENDGWGIDFCENTGRCTLWKL